MNLDFTNHDFDQLRKKIRSLLEKDGYDYSDPDIAVLEEILALLDELIENSNSDNDQKVYMLLMLVLKFLEFLGIQDISDLF